ncbi:hypothetical protein BJV82DRAFT_601439 [Fennellomyces sp. T-0311]|nr:hypothetical protein BJV82DRAFT_601439 [Fennellomyces sp. T-0311]
MFGSKRPTGDDELTLSRRQHGNSHDSSHAYTYHDSFVNNGSHISIPSWHSLSLHRIRRIISHRPSFLWWGIVCCVLTFLLLRMPSSTPPSKSRRNQILFTHDLVEYQDTTQMTDYALLDRLLKNEQGDNSRWRVQFNRQERTPNWIANGKDRGSDTYSRQLLHHRVRGHSSYELEKLGEGARLRFVDEHARTVPVTAIIYYSSNGQLHTQIESILGQSVVPEALWIVCTPSVQADVKSKTVAFKNNKRVKIMVWDPIEWLQVALRVSTEYLWIIDQDIQPGKRYLERLLRLSMTDEYRHAFLGTQAVVFKQQHLNAPLQCIVDVVENGSFPSKSQSIDMITDLWLFKRSWLSAVSVDPSMQKQLDPRLFGYSVSRSLRLHADIPSIVIPTETLGQDYQIKRLLGGTKATDAKSSLCSVIESYLGETRKAGLAWRESIAAPGIKSYAISTKSPVMFVFDGLDHKEQFVHLACQFQRIGLADVHIITTGEQRGLSAMAFLKSLQQNHPECAEGVNVHDLDAGFSSMDTSLFLKQATHGFTQILSLIQPRVIIYLDRNSVTKRSIQVAADMTKVTAIGLPPRDIKHASWMASLPAESLASWNDFSIKLAIVTDRKPYALARLIRSAARAHYFGDKVDMAIVMEQSCDRVTQAFVNGLPWPHGNKDLRHRITKVNRMPVYVEAWYPADDHEYGIVLDDSVELSEMFYVWAKYAILRYRYGQDMPDDAKALFGISLYSPHVIESDPEGRQLFEPSLALISNGYDSESPYLMQAANSFGGAVYFPEHWREFHDFITARVTDINKKQLQNVTVPNTRSSQWVNSWRRYMDELIYMRAYVMLYPNFENYVSLSTSHLELSSHVISEYAQAAELLRVPLMTSQKPLQHQLPGNQLPTWYSLPVLDLWGNVDRMESLRERGLALQRSVSSCTPLGLKEHLNDPSDLLCPSKKLVPIPVTSEDDPVPDFATRVVTVFVDSEATPDPQAAAAEDDDAQNNNNNNNNEEDEDNNDDEVNNDQS